MNTGKLLTAILATLVLASCQSSDLPTLTDTAQIRTLSLEKATLCYPVQLRGAVTLFDPIQRVLFIQDETGGISVDVSQLGEVFEQGSDIVVAGVTSPGDVIPVVIRPTIEVVDRGLLPEARVIHTSDLSSVETHHTWIEIGGVVRSARVIGRDLVLDLVEGDQTVKVVVLDFQEIEFETLLNARVRVRGLANSAFDVGQRAIRLQVFVQDQASIFVDVPAPVASTDVPSPPQDLPTLRRVSEVRSISPEEADKGYPVRLEGIVTYYHPEWFILFIQDETAGIYVDPHGLKEFQVRTGQRVELQGRTSAGDYAPLIADPHLTVREETSMPPPQKVAIGDLLTGTQDSQWIEVEGIVRTVSHSSDGRVFLQLAASTHRFKVTVPNTMQEQFPRNLVDAKVRIQGVCGTLFNARRQLTGFQLFTPAAHYIEIIDPANADPFSMKVRPVNSLLQFSAGETNEHRVRITGDVTYQTPNGEIYLEDETGSVVIRTSATTTVAPGDRVDVLGFVALGTYSPEIQDAVVRVVITGPPPEPIPIASYEAISGNYNARLVQIDAFLMHQATNSSDQTLTLHSGKHLFTAQLAQTQQKARLSLIRTNSLVRLTGICIVQLDQLDQTAGGRPQTFRILLRSPEDVVVLEHASMWTLGHLLGGLGLMAVFVLLSLTWVNVLQRRVRQQTAVIDAQRKEAVHLAEVADAANRSKSEFLANMSHEIRTPMNAILGFAEILRGMNSDPAQSQYLNSIQSSGKSLLGLINDILDMSKVEAGKLELEYTTIDAPAVFNDMQPIFAQKVDEKGIDFLLDLDEQLPPALILDETRLRQMLINLLGNAIKFTEKGHVRLSVQVENVRDGNSKIDLHFTVEDTGIGIPEDQQDKVFGAFEQTKGQSYTKFGGTGLGLAITKKLIEMMNGEVWIESEVDKGSAFHVRLQDVAVADMEELAAAEAEEDIEGIVFESATVLVADDIDANRQLVSAFLNPLGLTVMEAVNGKEAVEYTRRHRPDLIFMDIRMPEMDGIEATHILKEDAKTKEIPIVVLTASVMRDDMEQVQSLCDGFLKKPVSKGQVVQELCRFLSYSREEAETTAMAEDTSESRSPEELDDGTRLKLPELADRLENELKETWEELRDTLMISETEEFASRMQALGNEYGYPPLITWGERLQEQASLFQLDALPGTVEQFPQLIEEMRSYSA